MPKEVGKQALSVKYITNELIKFFNNKQKTEKHK